MKKSGVVIAACVVVLLGAWVASRALSGDVTPAAVSNPNIQTVNINQVIEPELPRPISAQPTPKFDREKVLELAQNPGQVRPFARNPQPEPAEAPVEEAENPFTAAVSPELDYADKLMWEADGGIERLTSARDVYARCVEAAPTLQRCKDGLAAATERLSPRPRALAKPEQQPTLKGEDLRRVLPSSKPPGATR